MLMGLLGDGSSASSGGSSDPSFSSTVLIFSGIGSNGSTTIPDLSNAARGNATVNGNAQLSTSSPITGFTSSLLLDGTGDSIQWSTFPALQNPSGAAAVWTVETVWKPTQAGTVFAWGNDWSGAGTFGGFLFAQSDGSFRFYNGDPAGGHGFDLTSATSLWTTGTEYFLCCESNGSKVRIYLGALGSGTFSMVASTTTFDSLLLNGGSWRIGAYGFSGDGGGADELASRK